MLYRDGLGFDVLYEFMDHEAFDGVFLGRAEAAYHLVFVRNVGNGVGRSPTEDNLLVFYVPDADEWRRGASRLEELGHKPVKSFNPYWDRNGKKFEDPHGCRVVLQHSSWPSDPLSGRQTATVSASP